VHDVGVVLAHEDEPGAPHVGRQLVNLVKPSVDRVPAEIGIPEIPDEEVVGFGQGKLVALEIHAPNPKALGLQPLDQVASNEAARAAYQSSSHKFYSSKGGQDVRAKKATAALRALISRTAANLFLDLRG